MYTDNFNRANSNSLGSPWIEKESTGQTFVFDIFNNHLNIDVRGGNGQGGGSGGGGTERYGFAYYNNTITENQYSQLEYFSLANDFGVSAADGIGPGVRLSGADAQHCTGYFLIWNKVDSQLTLRKFVNQSLTHITGTILGTASASLVATDILRIEVQSNSTQDQVTGKLNGSIVLGPFTITGKIGAGFPGVVADHFFNTGSPGTQSDLETNWDNWEADDLAVLAEAAEAANSGIRSHPVPAFERIFPVIAAKRRHRVPPGRPAQAPPFVIYVFVGTGGIQFGGSGVTRYTVRGRFTGTGGMQFGGAASTSYTSGATSSLAPISMVLLGSA